MTIRSVEGGSYTLDNTTIVTYNGNGDIDIIIDVTCQTIDFNDATITYFTINNTDATTLTNINLPLLTDFNCSYNQFTDQLPDFGACVLLTNFTCDNNQFTDKLPSFDTCIQLQYFTCSNNQFTDQLPSFDTCVQLQVFYCNSNQFTDQLPDFGTCIQLQVFYCNSNQFTGTLPDFGTCIQLQYFICNNNQFTGTLPDFSACVQLRFFRCDENLYIRANVNNFIATLPPGNPPGQLYINNQKNPSPLGITNADVTHGGWTVA